MPLSFGGIALGVLIGYPLGGAAYQLFGKPAPFLFIGFFVGLNIGKNMLNYCFMAYSCNVNHTQKV